MAKEAPSLNEAIPMVAPMETGEAPPVDVINWNYSGFDGIGGKGGAGGISNSGGYEINLFLASVPETAVEDQVEEIAVSSAPLDDQTSEAPSEENFEEAAPETREMPEDVMAEPMTIPEEALEEPLPLLGASPQENAEPHEHEAPTIFGIDPEKLGEVIKESDTFHVSALETSEAMPEIKEVVPPSLRLGLLISALLFGIIWLYLKFKR